VEQWRPEAAAVELDHGGGVPVWQLTGGGSEVGEKLQEVKAVVPSNCRELRWPEE
jgi:hypothetical protein